MSNPQAEETTLEPGAVAEAEAVETPAPEPWTPERVLEWNRYYDLYVAAGVLLLVFLSASHKIFNPSLWSMLEAGRVTIQQRWPLTQDPFSYTQYRATWVNIPWAFEAVSAGLHDLGLGFSKDEGRQVQIASGLLVGLNATIRLLTALVLLNIRRPGPGLWWSAVCAALALGGTIVPDPSHRGLPFSIGIGGVAGAAEVDPSTWGLLLLALELAFLHAAINLGRRRALRALPVLFLLWANIDESFLFGLAILAATLIGARLMPARGARKGGRAPLDDEAGGDPAPPSWGAVLATLGASAALCLVNPNLYRVYPAALDPYLDLLRPGTGEFVLDQLSYFGPESRKLLDKQYKDIFPEAHRVFLLYYFVAVGSVLASFVLNRRRFRLGRFLAFVVAAALWAALRKLSGEFAVVGAAAMALNGQEWYQQSFGAEGRLGKGWAAWSIGGRAVTLIAVFALVVEGLTGYAGSAAIDVPVGFGVNASAFAFEAADYLKDAEIQGNVVNLSPSLGDALIWRAWPRNPGRKTYIDNRRHLFPDSLRKELAALRKALADDKPADWRPILDHYRATAVMLNLEYDQGVYRALSRSPDWYEFYDDGRVVMFGRADESPDLAFFKARQLDARNLVYGSDRDVKSSLQPPTPVSWLDKVFRARAMAMTQPHALAADRWLGARWRDTNVPPDPAHCYMAIAEARTALFHNPDDSNAYRILFYAYRYLTLSEAAVVLQATGGTPNELLQFRHQQQVTALNYAILTTPPPISVEDRRLLGDLHLSLSSLFRNVNYLDLERDHLERAESLIPADEFEEPLRQRLGQLNEALSQAEEEFDNAAAQGANLLQQADLAISRGLPGYAIAKLESAEEQGVNIATVKWRLVDLYCQTGQPDKVFDLVSDVEDPALNTGPGTPAHRQGMVSFLLGNYENTINLWRDRALKQVHGTETTQALIAARGLLQGDWKGSTAQLIQIPNLERDEAIWEMELGLCLLEAGKPGDAAEHFTRSLTIQPDLPSRPLIAYYLDKLGKPVPPPSEAGAASPTVTPKTESGTQAGKEAENLPKDPFARPPQ